VPRSHRDRQATGVVIGIATDIPIGIAIDIAIGVRDQRGTAL
jgi:hypothetical protein